MITGEGNEKRNYGKYKGFYTGHRDSTKQCPEREHPFIPAVLSHKSKKNNRPTEPNQSFNQTVENDIVFDLTPSSIDNDNFNTTLDVITIEEEAATETDEGNYPDQNSDQQQMNQIENGQIKWPV